jgi:hypothetical protein
MIVVNDNIGIGWSMLIAYGIMWLIGFAAVGMCWFSEWIQNRFSSKKKPMKECFIQKLIPDKRR